MGSVVAWYGLHKLFGTLIIVGAVLFVLWANKLKADDLKKWVTWLLVVGIVGMVLTVASGGKDYPFWKGKFRDGKVLEMMDADDGAGTMMDDGEEG